MLTNLLEVLHHWRSNHTPNLIRFETKWLMDNGIPFDSSCL
jgi:hypothetical protein